MLLKIWKASSYLPRHISMTPRRYRARLLAGIDGQCFFNLLPSLVEQADVKVDESQLVMGFIEIRIQFHRAFVRLHRLFVREALVGRPQDQTAGKITLRQIGV